MKRMNNVFAFILISIVLFSCTGNPGQAEKETTDSEQSSTYQNPLPVAMGDPYVLYAPEAGDRYYMYRTGGGAEDGFSTYSSADLINWDYEGQVYQGNTEDSRAIGAFWAPEVYKVKDRYYMFSVPNGETTLLMNWRIFA